MPSSRQELVASITRRYPFYSGLSCIRRNAIFRHLTEPHTGIAWSRIRGGYEVAAPLSDYVGELLYYFGDLDPKVTWVCSQLVKPGDVVLDVGANLGWMTLTLSAIVGDKGLVHAFEPNPEMCNFIDEAVTRNDIRNVSLYRVALGSEVGKLTLSVPSGNAGAASLALARSVPNSRTVSVPVRTLSSVVRQEEIRKVSFMKLDVEGFEPEVLKGAVEVFEKQPPDNILFELNECTERQVQGHPTIKFLSEFGYGFFKLPQRRLLRMRAVRFDARNACAGKPVHDFVAARLGSVFDRTAKLLRAS